MAWVGARAARRTVLGCALTKPRLIPFLLAKSLHPPRARRLCLGNPPGSGADLSQQSAFVGQTSELQVCFFSFIIFFLFSLLITLFFFSCC